jgi:hypothetical protein
MRLNGYIFSDSFPGRAVFYVWVGAKSTKENCGKLNKLWFIEKTLVKICSNKINFHHHHPNLLYNLLNNYQYVLNAYILKN